MANIKSELEQALHQASKTVADIAYGYVRLDANPYDADTPAETWLFVPDQAHTMLPTAMDKTYSEGYGSQELFGIITFTDGSWLERSEYDGSEWWSYKSTPLWSDLLSDLAEY